MVGAVTSYMGGNLLSSSIWSARDGTLGALGSAKNVFLNIKPSISSAFDNLILVSGASINNTPSYIDYNQLDNLDVNKNLASLADGMDGLQTSIDQAIADSNTIKDAKDSATTLANSMSTSIGTVDSAVTSWSDQANQLTIPLPGGGTYYKTNPINTNGIVGIANNLKNLLLNVPDGVTQIAPLKTMSNLKTVGDDVRNIRNSLTSNIKIKVLGAAENVRNSVPPPLNNAKADTINSVTPLEQQVNNTLSPAITDLTAMFAQVRGYEVPRLKYLT